jgi:O-methyltransferase
VQESQAAAGPYRDAMQADVHKREFFWSAFAALTFNRIEGDYVEFGCYGGRTFGFAYEEIAQRPGIARHMWAFDSFAGLPPAADGYDTHPAWKPGVFRMDLDAFHERCNENGIPRAAYTAVPGFYDDTLTGTTPDAPPNNIAFAYVDCDMYSSTAVVLDFLRPRLKHGMIIGFDDWFCLSENAPAGEKAAFVERLLGTPGWHFERYRDIGWAGTSFIVEREMRHGDAGRS